MIWANRSLDLITIGSMIYCNAFFLIWSEQTWQTCYCSDDNIRLKFLFGSYIPRHRLESVIAKYSKYPQPVQWLTATGAVSEHIPRKEDNSAQSCNSRFFKQRWRQRGKTYGLAALTKRISNMALIKKQQNCLSVIHRVCVFVLMRAEERKWKCFHPQESVKNKIMCVCWELHQLFKI